MQGKSRNHEVIKAIAEFLQCRYLDVLDAEYEFIDPRKNPKTQADLALQLGLVKT